MKYVFVCVFREKIERREVKREKKRDRAIENSNILLPKFAIASNNNTLHHKKYQQ